MLEARKDDEHIPWVVSQVNQEFRTLAITRPLLWTVVNIMYGPNRTRLHLQRSGQAPLDVTASIPPIVECGQGIKQIKKFAQDILSHCKRIRELRMVFLMQECLIASMRILKVPSTRPQLLEVGLRDPFPSEAEATRAAVACQPRYLCIHSFPVWRPQPGFWSLVTTFELRDIVLRRSILQYSRLLSWVAEMEALERLTLVDVSVRETQSDLRTAGELTFMRPNLR